jgi:hypothetical protein
MNDKTLVERLKAAGKYYCAYHDLFLLCREAATEIERMELLCQEAAEDIGRLEAEVKNWKETIKKYEDAYNALIVKNNRLQAELDNLALASHSDKRFSGYETIHINKDEVVKAHDMQREAIDLLKAEAERQEEHKRDMFACAAMEGLISNGLHNSENIARISYQQADAMLKAREKK